MSDRLNPEREQRIRYAVAAYTEGHSDRGFVCCSAHGAADGVRELLAELDRLRDDLAEMTRLRDNALRALSREDVDLDVTNLPDLIGDGLSGGGWMWENDPQDSCPQALVDDIVGIVRPVIAGVTQQRDQARRDAAHWQHELQLADARITELHAKTEAGEAK